GGVAASASRHTAGRAAPPERRALRRGRRAPNTGHTGDARAAPGAGRRDARRAPLDDDPLYRQHLRGAGKRPLCRPRPDPKPAQPPRPPARNRRARGARPRRRHRDA
ncbi:MAG: hypothetical protein AVDCRST_MAG88-1769, partial [uncultured Thermomicrobiales bacterium]